MSLGTANFYDRVGPSSMKVRWSPLFGGAGFYYNYYSAPRVKRPMGMERNIYVYVSLEVNVIHNYKKFGPSTMRRLHRFPMEQVEEDPPFPSKGM